MKTTTIPRPGTYVRVRFLERAWVDGREDTAWAGCTLIVPEGVEFHGVVTPKLGAEGVFYLYTDDGRVLKIELEDPHVVEIEDRDPTEGEP